MKVLVTGARGQVGRAVMEELNGRFHQAVGVDVEEMDITDRGSVEEKMAGIKPDVVLHLAAWTAVDAAEDYPEDCRVVNVTGTEYIADACWSLGSKLLYLSTDYVFDGTGERPWEPDDPCAPRNVYGRSKFGGEEAVRLLPAHYIVRTAWVFGAGGRNFVKTMLELGKTRSQVRVVRDQVGTPTYAPHLARLLVDLIESERYGCYHATNEGGFVSWARFATEIFRRAAARNPIYARVAVAPVTSEEYPAKAERPRNSRLSKKKLAEAGFSPLPDWRDGLEQFLKEMEV